MIISCCTAKKDDNSPFPNDAYHVYPSDYVKDERLLKRFEATRNVIFSDNRSRIGLKQTYAFDLYTKTGKAYSQLSPYLREQLKKALFANKLSWFFLSAGYGIVNALEPTVSYQATFNPTIAYKNKIPNATRRWRGLLSDVLDSAVSYFDPDFVFFFGSPDYSIFFKESKIVNSKRNNRIFESTGSSGPLWLAPKILALSKAILADQVLDFYLRHLSIKQPSTR